MFIQKFVILLMLIWSYAMEASYTDFQRFTEERQEHAPILKILYEEFLENLTPTDYPSLTAIGGSPGAGKTTFRKQFCKLENVHLHDMDEVMVRLPGYREDLASMGAKKAFEKWWPTARELAQILVQYAIQERYSIIYDRTCGAEGSYYDLLKAKQHGYHIHLIGLYVDHAVAKERILKREREEGRSMTEAILTEYRSRFSALWPYYLDLADEAELYQANGEIPRLIFSSKDGAQDGAIYDAFLQDGESFREFFSKKL